MVDGINTFLLRETAGTVEQRSRIRPNRERFRKITGAVDPRLPVRALELVATTSTPALVGEGAGYKVFAVRWPVFEGVWGEGLLPEPNQPPVARIVAIPDA